MGADRFDEWNRRARACNRGAAFLDSAKAALEAARLAANAELVADHENGKPMNEKDPLREAVTEMMAASTAVFMAREKLHAALKAKTLTPETRPGFLKGSSR